MNEKYTLEWESDEICQVYEDMNCMGTEEVVDLLNKLSLPRTCVLEIEDTNGDTLTSFILSIDTTGEVTVKDMRGIGSLADIDTDNIYDTEHQKIRIQLEGLGE